MMLTIQKNRELLAQRVVDRFVALDAKLTDFEADIRALWKEFDSLKTGEKILGCRTRKHFCAKHLHRTPRAVRYMLSGGNPVSKRQKAGETVSPIDAVYCRISALLSASNDSLLAVREEFLRVVRSETLLSESDHEKLSAIDTLVADLRVFCAEYSAARLKRAELQAA
jgi:hypothetical protein